MKKDKVLITGGAGFIGHHLVDYVLKRTNWDIVILDRLDLSGNLNRLTELDSFLDEGEKRVKFVWHDLKAEINEFVSNDIGKVKYIVHLAASSHVDRSIDDPVSFAMDNVVGTTNLLNWARKGGMEYLESFGAEKGLAKQYTGKFLNFSTDEVFGPAEVGHNHKEDEPHKPSNPYAASKSGQGAMGYAFFTTYGLPVITSYTMNNFGERQHPEKLIPACIRAVINGTEMPIFAEVEKNKNYCSLCGVKEEFADKNPCADKAKSHKIVEGKDDLKAVGSRFWLHSWNTASAIVFLLENGVIGESYNIVGFDELTNLELCEKVAKIIGKPLIPKFVDFHKTRPGHDRRYSLDGSKLKEMGWEPEVSFDSSLHRMVVFTKDNKKWQ